MSQFDNSTTATDDVASGSQSMRDYAPSDDLSTDSMPTESLDQTQEVTPAVEESTVGESDFSVRFDPKTLNPELLPAYKLMQGDYTSKTQELAKQRAEFEQYKDLISFFQANPEKLSRLVEDNSETEVEPVEEVEEEIPQTPAEFAEWIKGKTLEEARQMFLEQQQEQLREAKLNADYDEAEKVDPRLDDKSDQWDEFYANAIAGIVTNDPRVLSGQLSFTEATRQAVKSFDAYKEKQLMIEKNKLTEKAQQMRNPQINTSPVSTTSGTNQPKTMREAAAEFLN